MRTAARFTTMLVLAVITVLAWQDVASAATAIEYGLIAV